MKRVLLSFVTVAGLVLGGIFASTAEAHGPGASCGRSHHGSYAAFYAPRVAVYPANPLPLGYLPPPIVYSAPYLPYGYRPGGAISYSRPNVSFNIRW